MSRESGEMSFWGHLDVLRGALWRTIAATGIVTAILMCIPGQVFSLVLWPTRKDFFLYSLPGLDFSMELINIELSAQFFIYLKVSFLCAVIIVFPYIIYEVWKFILPALYENERLALGRAFSLSSVLFYLGVLLGYFVIFPVCLLFFANFSVSDAVTNTITLQSYISMFISMVLLTGVLFEFPCVILLLSNLGLVTKSLLRSWRKYAVVVVLIVSALITPSDPFSMFVLSIPLYALFEVSILLCRK